MQVTMTVERERSAPTRWSHGLLLAHYLRDDCGLKATNVGCDTHRAAHARSMSTANR